MDARQELEHIFRNGFGWYEANMGIGVIWHEYNADSSLYNDTYDEGGRRYHAGVYVPALWVIVTEDRLQRGDYGRKPTERITMAVSVRSMDLSGVSNPEEYERHLNDVIRYDERLCKVTEYNIRGTFPGSVVLGIAGTQIYSDEELVFDTLPPDMDLAGNHRPVGYPNNADAEYPFHDGPSGQPDFYTDLDGPIILDGGDLGAP